MKGLWVAFADLQSELAESPSANDAAWEDAEMLSYAYLDMEARITPKSTLAIRFTLIETPSVRVTVEFPRCYGADVEETAQSASPPVVVEAAEELLQSPANAWDSDGHVPRILFACPALALEFMATLSATAMQRAQSAPRALYEGLLEAVDVLRTAPPSISASEFVNCRACNKRTLAHSGHKLPQPGDHSKRVCLTCNGIDALPLLGVRRRYSTAERPLEARVDDEGTACCAGDACIVCFEAAEGGVIMVDTGQCGCVVCVPCFSELVVVAVSSRRLSRDPADGFLSITCPAHEGVEGVLRPRSSLTLADPDTVLQLHRFAFEDGVGASSGVVCPHRGCPNRPFLDMQRSVLTQCPECNGYSCTVCRQAILECECGSAQHDQVGAMQLHVALYPLLDEIAQQEMVSYAVQMVTPLAQRALREGHPEVEGCRYGENDLLTSWIDGELAKRLGHVADLESSILQRFQRLEGPPVKSGKEKGTSKGEKAKGVGPLSIIVHVMQRDNDSDGYVPLPLTLPSTATFGDLMRERNERRVRRAFDDSVKGVMPCAPFAAAEVLVAWGSVVPLSASLASIAAVGPVVVYIAAVSAPSLQGLADELDLLRFRRSVMASHQQGGNVPTTAGQKEFKRCPFCLRGTGALSAVGVRDATSMARSVASAVVGVATWGEGGA